MEVLHQNANAYISNEVYLAKTKIDQMLLDNNISLESALKIDRILKNMKTHLRNSILYTIREDCRSVAEQKNT